jgi:hypothetical protein
MALAVAILLPVEQDFVRTYTHAVKPVSHYDAWMPDYADWDMTASVQYGEPWEMAYARLHEAQHHLDMRACLPLGTYESERRAVERGLPVVLREAPHLAYKFTAYEPGWGPLYSDECESMRDYVWTTDGT